MAYFEKLRELYDELDVEIAASGVDCAGCGECCRFDRQDHILYASVLEREYLVSCHGEGAIPDNEEVAGLVKKGLRCPFQVDGRCEAREGRVLGCRLHFCPSCLGANDSLMSMCEYWHYRLKRLYDEFGLVWDYRPLFPL